MKNICALIVIVYAATALGAAQPTRRSVALIVTGGTVLTQNSERQVLTPGAVAIDASDIVEIAAPEAIAAKYQARETVDASGQVVLAGLINTHTHAPLVLYRGLADDPGL